jgi:ParB family transcriptional regulator, chromosome partitioning protein
MRRALGKGLSQLVGEKFSSQVSEVPVQSISPNARQPRRHFDTDALEELADSIRIHGVLSPILVRPLSEGKYELIAGERRWRASQIAGLITVPVVVRSVAGQDSLELAIIENIQRVDISAYEAALAYKALVEEFGLNQEDVAIRVGKTRTSVSNTMRLLRLPSEILQGLQESLISEGHARALLAFGSESKQVTVFREILENGLSVRDVEKLSKSPEPIRSEKKPIVRLEKDIHTKQLESALSERFGSPTKIERKGENGKLEVAFYSNDDLQRILDLLGVEL